MKTSKFKKICIVTGSRAEYGLLKNLLLLIKKEKLFKLQLVVTGSHLSKKYGLTVKDITKDRFKVKNKIDLKLNKDDTFSLANSMSIGLSQFVKIFEKNKPDIIILLGDRYEIFTASVAATLCRVPIGHIHGGEITKSLVDEAFRHSISKMSHLHFTATKEYKKRVIQMGEIPKNVYSVGGLGVDNIKATSLYSKANLEKKLNIKLLKRIVLVTYHPETLKKKSSISSLKNLFNALKTLKKTTVIFTMPNSDIESMVIYKLISKFVSKRKNYYLFKSLGQKKYYSFCNFSDFMIGNSSSGLLEMPTFKKFSINIGERQSGRIKAKSVIDSTTQTKNIIKAIKFALNSVNRKKIKNVINPYGRGGASKKIINVLKNKNFNNLIMKKFFNIKFK
ncbi:UDP-N-acetylglucosamine 2-epimerase [Pelagibacteraceae bacterium]|jgi:GDP/UDP-N,N'-diacetylbacillosamine 2-epimerase (hydrolysing)|nr:UDP-N-acetylglucosamine 2-epimerase [Pelagibacteraceae bacterium]